MTTKRVRRVFDAAFKVEALRRKHEQVALTIPIVKRRRRTSRGSCGVRPVAARALRVARGRGSQRRETRCSLMRPATLCTLVDYIDTWYNRDRRHSTLHYHSPAQYEQSLLRTAQAA